VRRSGLFVAATALTVAAVLAPAAAEAVTRSGNVDVTIPSTIVIDGSAVPVTISSDALTGYSDRVWVDLYNGAESQGLTKAYATRPAQISSARLKPGSIVARASLATTYCSIYSSDNCSLNSDLDWYQFVYGLTYRDSAPATAKYGSKLAISASSDGIRTTWTANAQQYIGYGWGPWQGADVTIGGTHVTTDAKGVATWVEQTGDLHTFSASVAESATVWSSTSTAVTPAQPAPLPTTPPTTAPKPTAPKPTVPKVGHIAASASALKAATALKKGLPKIRKVVKLTKHNDANHLIGKANGYTSAAVLYDRRLYCSDGPGVDCGATVEKFATTAKAEARKHYIQAQLKRYPFLGTESDTVHGHFLLRVSGDLTHGQTSTYVKAFKRAF
jgi:hypothetical protein